ncbi:MAG: ABC transporter substrate-binding protein [Pseudomonadota bacterium]
MMMKTLMASAAIAALSGGALADGHGDKIKVGMITTLSGGGAGLGIDVRDGFLLAAKDSDMLDIVVEDDQRKPDIAVQLADKMIQSEKVDVMTGIIWSNLAMAVVPAATAQGKFYLSPNAGPSALAGKGCHPLYFNVAWQNDAYHEAAGKWASENGVEKAFIMAPNYPAGQDALTGFKRGFGGDVTEEIFTQLGQTDYAAEIAQLRASEADTLFFFLPGGMGISFMKQLAGSGVDKTIVGPAFSFDQGILGAIGDAALGVKNTAHWAKDTDNAANTKFVADFQAEYGRLPSIYAAQGYDTALLLMSAAAKADVSDADAFRAALAEAEFDSVRGDFSFAPNQHPVQDILIREVVKEGDVVTNRTIGVAATAYSDPYGADCQM